MVFLFKYYPQYTTNLETVNGILEWLIREAKRIEVEEPEKVRQSVDNKSVDTESDDEVI